MNQAGLVLLAVAALWIAYLVPHRLRYRQQLLESRADDRFSEGLRVLRVARATGGRASAARASSATRVLLHPPRAGDLMDRPHAATDRVVADAARRSAAEHARRVAYLARRAAAARRRAALTLVLLAAAAVGWAVVGLAGMSLLAGVVPTAGLVGVLALGRYAARAGARADAEWAAGAATRVPLTTVTAGARTVGRAVRPSDAQTEVLARVPAQAARSTRGARGTASVSAPPERAREGRPAAAEDEALRPARRDGAEVPAASARPAVAPREATWSPVPVPPPAYTLKPSAPRREPAPLTEAAPAVAGAAPEMSQAHGGAPEETSAVTPAAAAPAGRPDGPGLDLDAILARRRAAGE